MGKLKKTTTSNSRKANNAGHYRASSLAVRAEETIRSSSNVKISGSVQKLPASGWSSTKSIQFGKPSNSTSKVNTTSGGDAWKNLLKSASSSSFTNLIGGGLIQAGMDSLISGLASFFDGDQKSDEVPLVRFALPESQQYSLSVNSTGHASSDVMSQTNNNSGAYMSLQPASTTYSQSEIVQAVKKALLTSTTLSDVISEI